MEAWKKRIWPLLAAVIMSLALLLTGCGGEQKQENNVVEENEYKDLAGVYYSDLSVDGGMSVELYLQIDEEGNFVFSRSTDFSDKAKGAGYLAKGEDGSDTFVYQIVKDTEVEYGENVSRFEVTEDGGIQFVSIMWFGFTTPRLTAEDGSETYPLFVPYDENAVKDSENEENSDDTEEPKENGEDESGALTDTTGNISGGTSGSTTTGTSGGSSSGGNESTGSSTVTPAPEPEPEPEPEQAFQEGTYTGTYDKYVDAMGSTIHYNITLSLSSGSYSYQVSLTVSGNLSYSDTESYSGSYVVNGDYLSMTGVLSSATAQSGSLTVTGVLSSFAGSSETVTLYR